MTEYLAPRDGRPASDNRKANDLANWQTKLVTDDIEMNEARLREGKYSFVSSGLIQFPEPALGFKRSFLVFDPDAYVMQLIEK